MPTRVSTPERCIEKYIREKRKSSKTETYDQYRTVLNKISRDLESNGFNPMPYDVSEKAVRFLLDEAWKDHEVSTRKWLTHILSRYLRHFGNTVVADMDIRWPQDMRPNVDWLTDAEQYKLLNAPKTVLEEAVIHLELNMGLRIAEVCNLKLENINYRLRMVEVLGKGHGEGKWRSVPFSDDTEDVLSRWLKERQSLVDRVRAYDPSWKDPGNVFIWCHYKNKPQAGAYSDRGHSLDRGVIHIVRDRLGLNFTNHTLRRTFGRTMYHAGAPIESISKILGHDDIVTTLKYLGINLDDMQSAMDLHGEYQRKIRMGIIPNRGVQRV
ncbi:MAG: site-specific integrase [Candidatus Methanomethylophilaceae archaeon]|nr:site-specific integrase [Candidatus Methanomethylophilaceae archaeon]MBR4180850.1 site-specific integrase [Candidatus Methanomethylophilaceae archaeon]